jgi:hypothetical protein
LQFNPFSLVNCILVHFCPSHSPVPRVRSQLVQELVMPHVNSLLVQSIQVSAIKQANSPKFCRSNHYIPTHHKQLSHSLSSIHQIKERKSVTNSQEQDEDSSSSSSINQNNSPEESTTQYKPFQLIHGDSQRFVIEPSSSNPSLRNSSAGPPQIVTNSTRSRSYD